MPSSVPHGQVYWVVVQGARPTKAVLSRRNALNASASHGRWFSSGNRIIVASELEGETLDDEDADESGHGSSAAGPCL